MALRNSKTAYGGAARALHWLMALAIPAMFGLGLWMRSLDYYSPWYRTAPDLHKSIGLVLLVLLLIRLVWRLANVQPDDSHLQAWERLASRAAHWGFYGLLLALFVSGYLISTADGRPIAVFGLVDIPATLQLPQQEDVAGKAHELIAYAIIALAAVHALAALKHHFIDKDATLVRMWAGRPVRHPQPRDSNGESNA